MKILTNGDADALLLAAVDNYRIALTNGDADALLLAVGYKKRINI